jgi:hypothetical protein
MAEAKLSDELSLLAAKTNDRGEQEKLRKKADLLVAQAREKVTVASRWLVVFILAIGWSWLSNVGPYDLTGGKAGTLQDRLERLTQYQSTLSGTCNTERQLPQRLLAPVDPSTEEPAARASNTVEDGFRKQQKEDCQKVIEETRQFVDSLSDSAYDFGVFKLSGVHLQLHPLILMILILWMFAYLSFARRSVLSRLARAARIYRCHLKCSIEECADLLTSSPVWLWPLPSLDGRELTAREFAQVIYTKGQQIIAAMIHTIFLVTILCIVYTIYLAQAMLSSFKSQLSQIEDLENYDFDFSLMGGPQTDGIIIIGLGFVAFLLIDIARLNRVVPDDGPVRDTFLPSSFKVDRRAVGGLAARWAVTGAVLIYTWTRALRQPRFRGAIVRARMDLDPDVYARSDGRGRMHLVRGNKTVRGVGARWPEPQGSPTLQSQTLRPKNWKRTTLPRSVAGHRLDLNAYSEAVESIALGHAMSRRYDEAIALLRYGIGYGSAFSLSTSKPNLRLYDLLAALAVRAGRRDELEKLERQLALVVASTRYEERLERRIEKWRNPDSAWHQRWRSEARKAWRTPSGEAVDL